MLILISIHTVHFWTAIWLNAFQAIKFNPDKRVLQYSELNKLCQNTKKIIWLIESYNNVISSIKITIRRDIKRNYISWWRKESIQYTNVPYPYIKVAIRRENRSSYSAYFNAVFMILILQKQLCPFKKLYFYELLKTGLHFIQMSRPKVISREERRRNGCYIQTNHLWQMKQTDLRKKIIFRENILLSKSQSEER